MLTGKRQEQSVNQMCGQWKQAPSFSSQTYKTRYLAKKVAPYANERISILWKFTKAVQIRLIFTNLTVLGRASAHQDPALYVSVYKWIWQQRTLRNIDLQHFVKAEICCEPSLGLILDLVKWTKFVIRHVSGCHVQNMMIVTRNFQVC